jgi:hypothetical protein
MCIGASSAITVKLKKLAYAIINYSRMQGCRVLLTMIQHSTGQRPANPLTPIRKENTKIVLELQEHTFVGYKLNATHIERYSSAMTSLTQHQGRRSVQQAHMTKSFRYGHYPMHHMPFSSSQLTITVQPLEQIRKLHRNSMSINVKLWHPLW